MGVVHADDLVVHEPARQHAGRDEDVRVAVFIRLEEEDVAYLEDELGAGPTVRDVPQCTKREAPR